MMKFTAFLLLCSASGVFAQSVAGDKTTEVVVGTIFLPGSGLMDNGEPLASFGMFAAQGAALILAIDGNNREERTQTQCALVSLFLLKVLDVSWTLKLMKSHDGPLRVGVQLPIR